MDSIKNFIQLTEKIATAGQPTETEFALISQHGYRHVINLAMPDHPHALVNEGSLARIFHHRSRAVGN